MQAADVMDAPTMVTATEATGRGLEPTLDSLVVLNICKSTVAFSNSNSSTALMCKTHDNGNDNNNDGNSSGNTSRTMILKGGQS